MAFRDSTKQIIALSESPWLSRGQFGTGGTILDSPSEPWKVNRQPGFAQPDLRQTRITEVGYTVIAVSPDGGRALCAGWNLTTAVLSCSRGSAPDITSCQPRWRATPDDQTGRAITPEERDQLFVLDTVSRRPIAILRHPDLGVWTGPAPASTLPLVRPGPPGATPVLIDRSTEAGPTTLPSRAPEVVTAAFSPDGRRVATWSWDNVLRVWDVDSQREIAALRGHRAGLTAAVFDVPIGWSGVAGWHLADLATRRPRGTGRFTG